MDGFQQARRELQEVKAWLDLDICSMFVLCKAMIKRSSQTMIHAGTSRRRTVPGEAGQEVNVVRRLLAKAEQQIRALQEKVADQKLQLSGLQAEVRHGDKLATEREELKGEIAELRSEAKELIRANREQVRKIELLQAEISKLKVGAKDRKPNGVAAGLFLDGHPYRNHGEIIETQPRQNARQAQSS